MNDTLITTRVDKPPRATLATHLTSRSAANKMKPARYIAVVLMLGVCLCILGIGLIIAASLAYEGCEKETAFNCTGKAVQENAEESGDEAREDERCVPSDEAMRIRLYDQLIRAREVFYYLYPNNIIWHPLVENDDIKRFRPYNCSPSALKERSDTARMMYEEVAKLRLSVNESLLKPRELKSLIQLLHYLKTDFGKPYGENYYAGDWMMGPSRFCSESICKIGIDLYYHFSLEEWAWKPKTVDDITYLIQQLQDYRNLIRQYISNIEYGIRAGMVRSSEECEAGYYSLSRRFFKVFTMGSRGIIQEWFAKDLIQERYLSYLEDGVKEQWFSENGRSVRDSINATLVEYVGKPLNELFTFLKYKQNVHCIPSNISSGLATLPLENVYYNGSRTSNRTTKRLPFGEEVNGKKAYESILYFFTSKSDLTPDAIHSLGREMLHSLYAEAANLAMNYTGKPSNEAVKAFKEIINNQSSYFNDGPFPRNESNEDAFTKCSSLTEAKVFCPKRYEAFEKWASFVRRVLSMLEPKTINMFHFAGDKRTTPSCPVNVVPNFNPKTGSQSYISSGSYCLTPCRYRLPFFMDNLGPVYNAFSVAGHEARPGHHTQIQGSLENFNDVCSDSITWLDTQVNYPSFTEGWALYAENPLLSQGTDIYNNNHLQKYGMLKWQIWRAIRLVVDTGLHYKGMKRSEALEYHDKYAWDTTDKATKDVTRYQSNPGQATAYMIGQLELWRLRNLTKQKFEEANKKFIEKDFHYQILSQGKSPLEYLRIHINNYIKCATNDLGNCEMFDYESEGNSQVQQHTEQRTYRKVLPILYRQIHEHFD